MAKEEKKKNSKAQEETVEATETETKAEEATEEKEPTAEEKLTEELKKEKEKYSGNIRIGIPLNGKMSHLCTAGTEKLDIKWLCKMQKMHHRNF